MVAHNFEDTQPVIVSIPPRIRCIKCRSSEPLFAMTNGSDGALSMSIVRRGNHFHMIGLWLGKYSNAWTSDSLQHIRLSRMISRNEGLSRGAARARGLVARA